MRRRSQRTFQIEKLEDRRPLAANVLLVSDLGADDAALQQFLTSRGHTIDADSGAFTTTPPTAGQLEDVDVVVMSRATNSGNYIQGTEAFDWNALAKPMLVLNPQPWAQHSLGIL